MERIPRPKGATLMALDYKSNPVSRKKQALFNHLISHFLTSNFTYCGQQLPIDDFSILTQIPKQSVMVKMSTQLQGVLKTFVDKENKENPVENLMGLILNNALQDRGLIYNHYSFLEGKKSRAYNSFLSGDINRTLDTLLKSNSQFMTLLGYLQPKQPLVSINNQNNQNQQYITMDEALKVLSTQNKDIHVKDLVPEETKMNLLNENIPNINYLQAQYQIDSLSIDTNFESIDPNKQPIPIEDPNTHPQSDILPTSEFSENVGPYAQNPILHDCHDEDHGALKPIAIGSPSSPKKSPQIREKLVSSYVPGTAMIKDISGR